MQGRKKLKDEVQASRYLGTLAPKYFKFLEEMLSSDAKVDNKWAAEQLGKLITKTVPQELPEGGEFIPVPIMYVQRDNSNPKDNETKEENQSNTRRDSSEQDSISSSVSNSKSTE